MSITLVVGISVLAFVVLAGGLGYVISVYNSIVQVKNNVEKAWKNIDVLLMQRHDELPNLVEICKAYMTHERQVLERVVQLRQLYLAARSTDKKVAIENELNRQVQGLGMLVEQYPDLKAHQNFLYLQGRISALEDQISDRREFFNDSVNIYNIQVERFPEVLVARLLGYRTRAFLDVPPKDKAFVKTEFK